MFKGKSILLYLSLTFLLLGTVTSAGGHGGRAGICDKVKPCQLLPLSDAERMLGQSARLMQDNSQLKGDVRQCLCSYTGAATDTAGAENSVLYFSLEEKEANPSAEQARQVLASTRAANEHDTSIVNVDGIGDEAILFGNDDRSHFLMARKGAVIMRLQIKRAKGTRSLEEFEAFAQKVSKQL